MKYMLLTFGEAATMFETKSEQRIGEMMDVMHVVNADLRAAGELIDTRALVDGRHGAARHDRRRRADAPDAPLRRGPGHLLELAGERGPAREAYLRAAGQTASVAERRHLALRAARSGATGQ